MHRLVVLAAFVVACSMHGLASAQVARALPALDQKDCGAATDALNQGMTDNEAASFYVVGQLFEYGICLKKDPAKAASVYSRGASLGDAPSAKSLALLLARGQGVAQSYPRSAYWFAVARRGRKEADAMNEDLFSTPDTVARTYVEAVHALAEQDVAYPDEAATKGVQGSVTMRFDPRAAAATLVGSTDNQGSSTSHLGPNRHLFERVLMASYDGAIKALPKPVLPDGVDYATDQRVAFDRDRSSKGPQKSLDIRR